MIRTNQNQVSNPTSDQLESSQDESAQKDVAKLTIGLNQATQRLTLYLDKFAGFAGADSHQSTASGKEIQFAGEHTRSADGKHFFSVVIQPKEIELTRNHYKELNSLRTRFNDGLSTLGLS